MESDQRATPKKPRWRTRVARDFNHPNAFLSEGGALPVVVESFPSLLVPSRPPSWEREKRAAGVIGGARGELSPVGGSKGRSPSPAPMYYIG